MDQECTKVKMPGEHEVAIKFRKATYASGKSVSVVESRAPFTLYADFETLVEKYEGVQSDGQTVIRGSLPAVSCAYTLVCSDPRFSRKTVVMKGQNCAREFLDALKNDVRAIIVERFKRILDRATLEKADGSHGYYIVNKEYDTRKLFCQDRDLFTNTLLGIAHRECALNVKYREKTPVVFQNLTGFDSHLFLNKLSARDVERLDVLPQNDEQILCFRLGNFRFIDSMKFHNDSLDRLVALQRDSNPFINMRREFGFKTDKLLTKGGFPYSWFDSAEKFKVTQLPPIECFFNDLLQEGCDPAQYGYAQEVWKTFECRTFEDYHDIYSHGQKFLPNDTL